MQEETKKIIEEQFRSLPHVVQDAILSSDMDVKFQALAQKHKLHFDQWDRLENQIMLTVLGLSEPGELVDDIVKKINLSRERAQIIVDDISTTIFKPIREKLERELEHPEAKPELQSSIETRRAQILGSAENESTQPQPAIQPVVMPATPPQTPPVANVVRMPASGAYKPGEASTQRASIVDDPYREPPQ